MNFIDGANKAMVSGDNIGLRNQLVSKINNFHLLCVYDGETRLNSRNHLKSLAHDILRGEKEDMPIFGGSTEAETFFVWEDTYQENSKLFFKLRRTARDDLIFRISVRLAAYFLKEYSTFISTSISRHPQFQNKDLLDTAITKLENLLRNSTFLAEDVTWDNFCRWFKYNLTEQVLDDMERTMGRNELQGLKDADLNNQFYHHITKQLQIDSDFISNFTSNTEQYLQQWFQQVISSIDADRVSVSEMGTFLEVNRTDFPDQSKYPLKMNVPLALTDQDNLTVLSNAAYQSVREVISNKCFAESVYSPWPTAYISKKTIEGTIQIVPFGHEQKNDQVENPKSRELTNEISELAVDVIDALCSFFLANSEHRHDMVEIKLRDLLMIRGLKAKLSGNGRRGGFEKGQVDQILKSLSIVQSLWVNFSKAVVYEKRKPVQVNLEGRTFRFFNQAGKECDVREMALEKKLKFTVGEVFAKYLVRSGRQTALLPIKTLQYNPRQEEWEKKLIRYLSWRWRTQAKKGDYLKPHKVSSLLRAIGKEINTRTPSRTRDRFEQALDKLQDDNLIKAWEYEEWDESIAAKNSWSRLWRNTKVIINPPQAVKEQYQLIAGNSPTSGKFFGQQKLTPIDPYDQLGSQLKTFRKKLGLTLVQAATELELSTSYLSTIERGVKIPSQKVMRQIEAWIHG
ncbi:helix-turn-helix domain-containing protein [Virgibacillus phasianinus]|uniref:helix-turn-helix domain-containing protein n=1 Tax=Virgibacillus phasianinus TaxID=2017483 RepID=UPI0012FE7C35|nr:helix-turn-helix transcriptional regulator [Virgibacillus phasianinus]